MRQGHFADPKVMSRYVECICPVNSLTSQIISNITYSLPSVKQLLKTSIEIFTEQFKNQNRGVALELKNDDLEHYTRRQILQISGILETVEGNTNELVIDFSTQIICVEANVWVGPV